MNRNTAPVTAGVIVTLAVSIATAAPALASAGGQTVTQHFDAKVASSLLETGPTSFVFADDDVASGKTIGHDVLSCTDAGTGTSSCDVAFAQKGGVLYATFSLSDDTGVLVGKVSGGTGAFKHAKGSLSGQAVSHKDTQITLRYKK